MCSHGMAMALMLLLSGISYANTSSTIEYKGRLLKSAPCVFVDKQPVYVEFGDVQVRDLNGKGGNYEKVFSFEMECKDQGQTAVRHIGTATSFNDAAVVTNIDGLGVELRIVQGDVLERFPVGSKMTYFKPTSNQVNLILSAVPFKDPNKTPELGPFSATSTVQLEYP